MFGDLLASRWFQTLALLALLVFLTLSSFSHARWRDQIRNFTFDNYNIALPRAASGDVVIVDIDESSLKEFGQMPWPRDRMGELVSKLKGFGARVIVFDIVFSEPDRVSPPALAPLFDGHADIAAQLAEMPDNDVLFAQAIREAGNVITGFSFTHEKTDGVPVQKGLYRGKNLERFVTRLPGATVNLKTISAAAAGNGSFFVSTDTDGIIRRVPMLVGHQPADATIISVYPSLALEALRVLDGQAGGQVMLADQHYAQLDPGRFGIRAIRLGRDGRTIPLNAHGEFPVYFAPSDPGWYISAGRVLAGAVDPAALRGKIVLVGTSAVGLKDIRSTPLNTFVPGVEVHLNIIDQILHGQFLTRAIEAEGLEAFAILACGLLIIVAAPFVEAFVQTVLVAVALCAGLYGGFYAFAHYGLVVDVAYPALTVVAMFLLSSMLTYLRTERERRQVRQAFGLYISPDFMKELTDDPAKLRLGGQERELTVMFTDIRNFTGISEGLPPEDLIHLMNDFLTPMSDLVMNNRGTIDKYMGDAMMAFWNAPLDDADHARHACQAALGMQNALRPINAMIERQAAERGRPVTLLRAGIGLNTGACAVGNMGSRRRFAYSALGDAANIASRLEGQTKIYGVSIIIGEATRQAAPGFASLPLEWLRVKGREEALEIHVLIGDEGTAQSDMFLALAAVHAEMTEAYRAGDFARALAALSQLDPAVTLAFDLDRFYTIRRARLEQFVTSPPSDWDGIAEAQAK